MAGLALPKEALRDIRVLIGLDARKLTTLRELFGSPESVPPIPPSFLREAADRLQLDPAAARSVVVAGQVLLSWTERGAPTAEILEALRDFAIQNIPSGELQGVLAQFDANRAALQLLLTPQPGRVTIQKLRYLTHGLEPTVDSFRTICELRPVFEYQEGRENIVGYASIIALEAKLSNVAGEQQTVLLHFTPNLLKSLGEVVRRAEKKMESIHDKFGAELLGD